MAPASGGWTPQSTFTIVLLPAPFSPRRAWISPASHENSAPSSATTPPNRLSIPVALRRGILVLKSPGRDEQVTHLSLVVKPVTERNPVGATRCTMQALPLPRVQIEPLNCENDPR